MKRILIIQDDSKIVELIRCELGRQGFQVRSALDGATGLAELKKTTLDLLIIDLTIPVVSAEKICRQVREDDLLNRLPILMLSPSCGEADIVAGFEMGADDCVTKPFSPRELIARIKTLLWRAELLQDGRHVLKQGNLMIDPGSHRVSYLGRAVPMSLLEFRFLYHLTSHPNCVFTRVQLLDAVWDPDHFVGPRCVDVCVRRLRKKLETDPKNPHVLRTVRGAGYLLVSNTF